MISYREELKCSGVLNTKENLDCTLHKGSKKDTIVLKDPLSTDGKDVENGIYVGIGIG